MKFSIVIPVYNTYDYLDKCLKSVVDQTISKEHIELIIVNDGTPDNSEEIILKYKEQYPQLVKYIKKENGGQAEARNDGVKQVTGDYILFVDSDDYLDIHLLEKLKRHIEENNTPDVVRIDSRDVKTNGEVIKEVTLEPSKDQIELIKNIMHASALEVPWAYVYNAKFYRENNFQYLPYIHEDFGLLPIIIYRAKTFTHLEYIGYNYVEREGSIMAEINYEKIKKRVDDMYIQYCNHMKVIQADSVKGKLLRGYSLEAMLNKLRFLNEEDLDVKLKEIEDNLNVSDLYCYNLKKTIKKAIYSLSPKLYLKLYKSYKM